MSPFAPPRPLKSRIPLGAIAAIQLHLQMLHEARSQINTPLFTAKVIFTRTLLCALLLLIRSNTYILANLRARVSAGYTSYMEFL